MRPLAFAAMGALAAVLCVGLVAARRAARRQAEDLADRIERIGHAEIPHPDDLHHLWIVGRREDRPAVPVTPWQRAHRREGGRR